MEPIEIVERTNELKSVYAEIKAEENRIYFEMCRTIFAHREDIRRSAEAVAEIDLFCSRARLGAQLQGIIPEVGLLLR